MKTAAAVLAFVALPAWAGGPYLAAGYDARLRDGSYDIAAGWLWPSGFGVEAGFNSMGAQPDGYENVNKFATINLVGYTRFSERVTGFGKIGVHTSKWSHNGTNDYDRSGDSLLGYQAATGLETPVGKHARIYAQAAVYSYRQVNNPNVGGYVKPSVGVRWEF